MLVLGVGFSGSSSDKELKLQCLIPGLGRSAGEGNSYPLQYSGLENSMDRGAWQAIIYGVAKSWTRHGITVIFQDSQLYSHWEVI